MSDSSSTHYLTDELEEDPMLMNARYVGISFLSPDKILKKREIFLFEKFVESWDLDTSLGKFTDFLHFLSEKFNLKIEILLKDFQDFAREEKEILKKEGNLLNDYKNFLDREEKTLGEQFQKENQFQTSVRGLKIRTPTVGSIEEAEQLVKKVRERDPNHDIYIGEVGKWMPWDPEAYKTGRMEYLETKLNELHHAKTKNEELAKIEFDKRVKDTKKKAILDNIEKAKKSNNVLTQTLDEKGNLVGAMDKIDLDTREPATDIMKEAQREELLKKHGLSK